MVSKVYQSKPDRKYSQVSSNGSIFSLEEISSSSSNKKLSEQLQNKSIDDF